MLPNPIKTEFYRFLEGRTPLAEFEKWVYGTPDLEAAFDHNSYIDLLAADFSDLKSREQIETVITSIIDPGDYATWQIRSALAVILPREESELASALNYIYRWYCYGYRFLDNLAIGFALAVVVPAGVALAAEWTDEWQDLPRDSQSAILDSFYPKILDEANKVLRWLDTKAIVVTGLYCSADSDDLEYLDRRSAEEKRPTAYTVHNPLQDAQRCS